jgi:CheY-like chemotaxis protein/HPt (histidine-containing phosphotransfer) domain-containing protein
MMGGTIGMESQEGRGSTFWFLALLAPAAMPAEMSTASTGLDVARAGLDRVAARGPVEGGAARRMRDARILVAEDNLTNQIVVVAQLRKLGYAADVVGDGAQALAAVERCAYGLVLMDCEMPVMDGYEATRRIRESGATVPIVALTANAMAGDRNRCVAAGMNDFVSKPVELARLVSTLATWLPELHAPDAPAVARAAVTSATDVFDPEALLKRLLGDRELADIVMEEFLDDTPSRLDALRRRLADGDGAGARAQAHALRGASAPVSAGRLSAVALEMEQVAVPGEVEHIGQLLLHAVEEFATFQTALAQAGWA